MTGLVLSLFPGIGLLDMAFEEEGFCVVRGPDLLWGGDIRRFHPPAGRFDGVIGGPPCQAFSIIKRLNPKCGQKHGNMIPEFERVVAAARPSWFVMENVEGAPEPAVGGYTVAAELICDHWVGGETSRKRRFCFGSDRPRQFRIDTLALHLPDPKYPVLAQASLRATPIRYGGSGKLKAQRRTHHREKDTSGFVAVLADQGLPPTFLSDAPFTVAGKIKAVGNGVPLPMGRAVAKAVKRAIGAKQTEAA